MIEGIKQKVEKSFSHIHLLEDCKRDRYFYKEKGAIKEYGASVTKFCDFFIEPFDGERFAKLSEKKLGMKAEDILKMWSKKGRKAAAKGNVLHEYIEAVYKNPDKVINFEDFISKDTYIDMEEDKEYRDSFLPMIDAFDKFYSKTKKYLIPIVLEYPMDSDIGVYYRITSDFIDNFKSLKKFENLDITKLKKGQFFGTPTQLMEYLVKQLNISFSHEQAMLLISIAKQFRLMGILDALMFDKRDNGVYVYDWKQGKDIVKKSKHYSKMLYPLNDIYDANYHKYSLQTSVYKHFLESKEIIVKGSRIVHFGDRATTFDMEDYRDYISVYFQNINKPKNLKR